MFNLFRKKTAKEFIEEAKETYIAPKKEETKEKPATTYYRIGLTSNNRVSFQMGYDEITMNQTGCENLIAQLTLFMNQLSNEQEEETADGKTTV